MKRKFLRQTISAHIGYNAGKETQSSGLRFSSISIATFLLILSFIAISAIIATSIEREDRFLAGEPVLADGNTSSPVIYMDRYFDTLEDSRQYEIIYLSPENTSAPTPPGVDEWPKRGEALLSPALLKHGSEEGIEDRYGDYLGTIGSDGLLDSGQLLAIVRPSTDITDDEDPGILQVKEWGVTSSEDAGWSINNLLHEQDFSIPSLIALAVATLLIPSFTLAVVATRVSAHERDRRERLITVLGASSRDRRWMRLGESFLGIVVGSALAAMVLGSLFLVGINVPHTQFEVYATDLRANWPILFAGYSIGLAASIFANMFLQNGSLKKNATRPIQDTKHRRIVAVASLCPLFIAIAVVLPRFFMHTPGYMILHWIGTIGAIVTLPALIGVCSSRIANKLATAGRDRRNSAMLISGSLLKSQPRVITRHFAGLAMAIVLFFLVAAYQAVFAGNFEDSLELSERYGTSTVHARFHEDVDRNSAEEFLGSLPDDLNSFGVSDEWNYETEETELFLHGDCGALERFNLECPTQEGERVDTRILDSSISLWLPVEEVSIVESDVSESIESGADLIIVNDNFDDISVPLVKNEGRDFNLPLSVSTIGTDFVTGAIPHYEQSRWISLLGIVGLCILGLATAVAASNEFLRRGTALAPINAISKDTRNISRTAAWMIAAPISVTVALGTGIGIWITRPLTVYAANAPGFSTAASVLIILTIIGVLMYLWSSLIVVRKSRSWLPGRDY